MTIKNEISCDNPKCKMSRPLESVGVFGGIYWYTIQWDDMSDTRERHFCSWACVHAYSHTRLPEMAALKDERPATMMQPVDISFDDEPVDTICADCDRLIWFNALPEFQTWAHYINDGEDHPTHVARPRDESEPEPCCQCGDSLTASIGCECKCHVVKDTCTVCGEKVRYMQPGDVLVHADRIPIVSHAATLEPVKPQDGVGPSYCYHCGRNIRWSDALERWEHEPRSSHDIRPVFDRVDMGQCGDCGKPIHRTSEGILRHSNGEFADHGHSARLWAGKPPVGPRIGNADD